MEISTIPMETLAELLSLQMESGGVASLVVTGNSMYPTFRNRRDVVKLVSVMRPLKRGDLILYQRISGQYVLHRIVSKPDDGRFICSGDNQWEKESVTQEQVVAIAQGFIRNGKQYKETALAYRLWVAFWVALFPVRRPLLAIRRRLGRLGRRWR